MKKTLKISLIIAAAIAVVSAVTISTNVLRASEEPDAQYAAPEAAYTAPEAVEYVEVAPAAPVEAPVVEAPAAAPVAEAPAAEAPAEAAPAEAPAEAAPSESAAETPAEGTEAEAPAAESAETEKPADAEKTEAEKTEAEKTEEEKTEEEKTEEEKSEEEESEEDEEEDEEDKDKEKEKEKAAAVEELSAVVMIMGNRVTTVYNGEAQIATGFTFTATVAGGELGGVYTANDFVFSGEPTVTGTDVGTYAMGLTPEMFVNVNPYFTNVTFVVVDGGLTISPLPVTLSTESGSWEYDGEAHSLPTVAGTEAFLERDGIVATADAAVTEVTDEEPVVNAITVTGEGLANYAITKNEGTLEVTENKYYVSIASSVEPGSKLRKGDMITLSAILSSGFEGKEVTYQWTVMDAATGEWTDIGGATGPSYSFAATKESVAATYNVVVTIIE